MQKIFVLILFLTHLVNGQDASRFASEVEEIQTKYDSLWDSSKETIVFTGSSSIRSWHNLQEKFPEHQIVNSGFGGSKASDLLLYTEELILQYNPKKVFIYEGDNDIAGGKDTKVILWEVQQIIDILKSQNSAIKVVLISPKPSIARWNHKRDYKKLNRKFRRMSRKDADILFADVWKPMIKNAKVREDLFLEDGLHMNANGYEIWYNIIKLFLD
jgi:lysophospholipase L1-like esterase